MKALSIVLFASLSFVSVSAFAWGTSSARVTVRSISMPGSSKAAAAGRVASLKSNTESHYGYRVRTK